MTPRNNLGVQTQIVAGAKAFVGTCGSIAWLAPRLGVDTSALFVDPKWLHAHLAGGDARLPQARRRALRGRRSARARSARTPAAPRAAVDGDAIVKVLFIARHFTYFRNFESVIAALAERGHHGAPGRRSRRGARRTRPGRSAGGALPGAGHASGSRRSCSWGRYRRLSRALRLGLDYLRYSDPRYEATPKIRERAYERTPVFVLALARLPFRRLADAARWRALERGGAAAGRRRRVRRRRTRPTCC